MNSSARILFFSIVLLPWMVVGQDFAGMDNFNDGTINTNLWGSPVVIEGNPVIAETNGHLHFWTPGDPGTNDYIVALPWEGCARFDRDWEVQMTAVIPDLVTLTNAEQKYELGLVLTPSSAGLSSDSAVIFGMGNSGAEQKKFYQQVLVNGVPTHQLAAERIQDAVKMRFRWEAASLSLHTEVSTNGGSSWASVWAPIADPLGVGTSDCYVPSVYASFNQIAVSISDNLYCDDFVARLADLPCCPVFPVATNADLVEFGCGLVFDGTNYMLGLLTGARLTGPGQDPTVSVQPFNRAGELVRNRVDVGNYAGYLPGAAFAFGQTNCLVAWSDQTIWEMSMFGQFVTRDGSKLEPVFDLLPNPGIYGRQKVRGLAFDGTNFLLVWQDKNDSHLYGQLVSQAGTLVDSEFVISDQAGIDDHPAIAFGNTNYLVTWQSDLGTGSNNTYGALISPAGSASSLFQVSQTISKVADPMALGFDGTNYLALWSVNVASGSTTNVGGDIFGRLISQDGSFQSGEVALVTAPDDQGFPAVAFDGSHYLLAWTDQASNAHTVRFRFFDRDVSPVGPSFTVFTTQGTNTPYSTWNSVLFDGARFAVAATLATLETSISLASGDVYGAFLPASTTPPELQVVGPLANGQFPLILNGTPGINYAIEMTTNLTVPNWIALMTNSPTNGPFSFTDTDATNTSRFYRAMALFPSTEGDQGFAGSDEFSDGILDTDLWGAPRIDGNGMFTETNGHLHFWTLDDPGTNAYLAALPWSECAPFGQDWEIQATLTIPDLQPVGSNEFLSIGLFAVPNTVEQSYSNRVLFAMGENDVGYKDFNQKIVVDNIEMHDSAERTVGSAMLRYRWEAATARLHFELSTNAGASWTTPFAPIVNPFGMSASDCFVVGVYGRMKYINIDLTDDLYCDDFVATLAASEVECRILSITRDGSVTWTNHPANLYCGLLYTMDLLDCWTPAPSPYWDMLSSNATTTVQLPPEAMEYQQFYLRLVCSTNPVSLPLPQHSVASATITVDGDTNDWTGIQPAVSDRVGEVDGPAGADITEIYLARDSTNMYVRIDAASGPPATKMHYGVSFYTNVVAEFGDHFFFVDVDEAEASVEMELVGSGDHQFITNGVLAVQGNIIEASVPLGVLAPPMPSYVRAWSDTNGPSVDRTCTVEAVFP